MSVHNVLCDTYCRSQYPEELTYKLYERRVRSRLAMGQVKLAIEVCFH